MLVLSFGGATAMRVPAPNEPVAKAVLVLLFLEPRGLPGPLLVPGSGSQGAFDNP
jgi:hypothetical protein